MQYTKEYSHSVCIMLTDRGWDLAVVKGYRITVPMPDPSLAVPTKRNNRQGRRIKTWKQMKRETLLISNVQEGERRGKRAIGQRFSSARTKGQCVPHSSLGLHCDVVEYQ